MSSGTGFVHPLLRSKSFSYGALLELADENNVFGKNNSRSINRRFRDQNRSVAGYEYENDDDEEMAQLAENTPLLIADSRKSSSNSVSSSTTTTTDSKIKKSKRRLSQWITRITPPFLLPPDANLQLSLVRDDNDYGSVEKARKKIGDDDDESKAKMNFSTKDKLMIAMISVAAFCSTVVFSCIAPFFPEEAKKKGASETVTGFVFGIFELVIVLMSPIFGRYLTVIGSKFMYGTGLCVTGVTAILFGLLNLAPAGTTFIALAFVVRIIEAVGDAAIVTSSFAIVAKAFTVRVATVIGVLETFSGLGFAAGPPIGGLLYEVGGFQMPFMVLGSLLIVSGLSTFFVIPKQNDSPTTAHFGSIFHLLRMQSVWTMLVAIMVAAISISFLDPTLQPHLQDFNLTPFLVGMMFLIMGGLYAISAPFWGYLIDRKDCAKWVMLFGCASSFVSLLFIGPSPIFPFEKQLWLVAVSEIFMGLGLGALFIPPFQQCLYAARQAGYPDSFETYGIISGLFQSSASFGAFFGPTVGGLMVESIGFPWATTALSLLHVICATLIVCLMLSEKRKSKLSSESKLSSTSEAESSPFASHHQLDSTSLLTESGLICSERSGEH